MAPPSATPAAQTSSHEEEQQLENKDITMGNTTTATITTTKPNNSKKPKKGRELMTCTIRAPPFAYAQLAAVSDTSSSTTDDLDALQVRAYCTSALRQFLGDTGAGMAVDILSVTGSSCWVRVPRADLGAFAAALTAFGGVSLTNSGGGGGGGAKTAMLVLQVQACGDWLGSLIGRAEQGALWTS